MNDKLSLLPVCLKCGAQCCKHGSPIVSKEERDKILKFSGKDYFEKKGDYYIIPKNPCPYLSKDDKCSIQKVKPKDCKTYPFSFVEDKNKLSFGISQTCPAKYLLSKEYISESKKILNKMPFDEKQKIKKYNILYGFNMEKKNKSFGQELLLDMYGCDVKLFTKSKINTFFKQLCKKIDMKRHGKPVFWHDDSETPHLKGTSAMQFITTSNIVVHALDILGTVYISIFSCKKFDKDKAAKFSKQFFRAERVIARNLERK